MEAEIVNVRPPQLGFIERMVSALLPVLVVSVGYIDPGKWVANIEGGARFGYDLVAITLLFNFAAILCQYVSARISVATGRNLAQICNEEYDKWTCMFLGVQAEFSAILLDLTMVIGVAHALNLLLGVDLSTGVFLAAMDAFFFPVFASFLENGVANTVSICSAGLVLLLYVSGVLMSQSEIPFSMNGLLTRLNGESAFALMGLLGASIVPHNFYIHSYFTGERVSSSASDVDKSNLCQDHLFAIFCVFSGLSLVNYVLMNAAANVFYSTGLVVLTFQDAMSLMEQVFRSPLIPLVFLMLLFFSSQITALSWAYGGEVVLHDFLKIEIPGWLHRATIRILAVAPALYCVWTSGADGIYQLLIFTQVLVAMMLPSSVIPLFRIASSRQIMGVHKIPQVGEFLALTTFLGFLGLNVVFVVEMVFGSSEWANGLRWNTVMGTSVQYTTLLVSSCASLCLMLWLAATPLKSVSNRVEAQIWNMDVQNAFSYPSTVQEEEIERSSETRRSIEEEELENRVKEHHLNTTTTTMSVASSVYDFPENILMTDQEIRSSPHEESVLDVKFSAPLREDAEVKEQFLSVANEVSDKKDSVVETKIEPTSPVEKKTVSSMEMEINNNNSKFIEKDVEGVSWEDEAVTTKAAPVSNSYTGGSDGPPSFRSLRSEDGGGSGTGSLSRLQGLGRAARRHLSAILDEFWGHLYDFHGQLVAEARAKKLDQLLGGGVDQNQKVSKAEMSNSGGYCMSPTAKGLDSSLLYDSLKQQRTPGGSIDSLYGLQRGGSSPSSSPLVNRMQMLSAYGNTTTNANNAFDLSERRYSSLRTTSSSEGWEHQQPATIHGYQIKSYVNNLAKERLEALQSRGEIPATTRSMAIGSLNYTQQLALALKQKSQNGLTPGPAPGFENFDRSRNLSRQSERSSYYAGVPNTDTVTSAVVANEKKYSSMPDISGLSMSARNMHLPNNNKTGYWDASTGVGVGVGGGTYTASSYGPSSLYSNLGSSRIGVSSGYRDAYTLSQSPTTGTGTGTGSLWSRQPFEQFGVAERNGAVGGELRNRSNPINIDNNNNNSASSTVDAEAKLLQSFRHCILKLIKLEGSEWLFGQSDGVDEELIDKVAARENFIYEAEAREMNQVGHMGEPLISSVPNCGDGCVWRADLIVSFGVWCIHRVLDLSLMESRPELWGKYTYVLNRLQGVIDPAFSKLRTPMTPCFCLQIPASHQRASPPSNGMLPPAAKPAKGKCTTAVTLLELIKDVEMAISCRKGRTGTAAGDVAFPKGKENLASVLKRYKRRLSNKSGGMSQDGPGSRKNLNAVGSGGYGSLG